MAKLGEYNNEGQQKQIDTFVHYANMLVQRQVARVAWLFEHTEGFKASFETANYVIRQQITVLADVLNLSPTDEQIMHIGGLCRSSLFSLDCKEKWKMRCETMAKEYQGLFSDSHPNIFSNAAKSVQNKLHTEI